MELSAIANAIIEHSIIPYAKASGIDVSKLIEEIAAINYVDEPESTDTVESRDTKRCRGRPKGARNKSKSKSESKNPSLIMRNIHDD
jgi:hypothetical protein